MSNEHRIERVSVISRAEDMSAARAQQSKLSRLIDGPVSRAWIRVMDRYAGVEETILIDRLELRLTDWSADLSEREIEQRLAEALDHQLQRQLADRTGRDPVSVLPTAVWLAQEWTRFLLTGRWAATSGPQAYFAAAVGEEDPTLPAAWREAYQRGGEEALDRLIRQLPLDRLGAWLGRIGPLPVPDQAFKLDYWRRKHGTAETGSRLYQAWLRTVAVAVAHPASRRDWVRRFWDFLLAQWPETMPLPDLGRLRGWPPDWLTTARKYAGKSPAELSRPDQRKKNDEQPAAPEVDQSEFRFVTGAGLVLLHPYLATFFKELGILDSTGKDFGDVADRERALQLCHWLVTGETTCHEQQTELYKLLCAWPEGTVPTTDHALPGAWLTAGEQLLRAVVRNWDKLGQASPDSLREGFLQREGKLGRDSLSDYLRVEQRGIDVLLEYLPWGIGVVKLPWMPGVLRVEWS